MTFNRTGRFIPKLINLSRKKNKCRWIMVLKTTKIRLKSKIPDGAQINTVCACTLYKVSALSVSDNTTFHL